MHAGRRCALVDIRGADSVRPSGGTGARIAKQMIGTRRAVLTRMRGALVDVCGIVNEQLW